MDLIRRQTSSYRQGLVLGLTMAEIMLLLVFCMLIAVAVVLTSQRAKLDDTLKRMKRLETAAAADRAVLDTLRRNATLAEAIDRTRASASPREIDEFWRKPVESNNVVTKIEHEGISLQALAQNTDSAERLRALMRNGIDPDRLVRGAALASQIDAAVAAHNTKLSADQIVALLDKSLTAAKAPVSGDGGHHWPPIINLSEADGYFFDTGSAVLTPNFVAELRGAVADRLLKIAASFDVDVIEVIGHTDEQPVNNQASNLDRGLAAVTLGGSGVDTLHWSDNAGLGLARALAVVKLLSFDPRLRSFRILPLSAAQLIGIDGRLTHWDGHGDVRERRRIEIRMRKSV